MFTSARESYLLREGFRTTSELFTLLGRDRIDWCSNWGGGNMGLYSGGGGLYVDRSLYTENMYWFWRRRLRQESALRKGAVCVVLLNWVKYIYSEFDKL